LFVIFFQKKFHIGYAQSNPSAITLKDSPISVDAFKLQPDFRAKSLPPKSILRCTREVALRGV